MGDMSGGVLTLVIVVQVVIFVLLVLVGIRLVKVIKSQNNNKILPTDVSAKLRKLFGRSPKS